MPGLVLDCSIIKFYSWSVVTKSIFGKPTWRKGPHQHLAGRSYSMVPQLKLISSFMGPIRLCEYVSSANGTNVPLTHHCLWKEVYTVLWSVLWLSDVGEILSNGIPQSFMVLLKQLHLSIHILMMKSTCISPGVETISAANWTFSSFCTLQIPYTTRMILFSIIISCSP